MKKIITVDGNEACSRTSYYFTEVAGIYPITPSSPMAEHLDEWSCLGEKNLFDMPVKVVEMQSEAGAAGFVHGSLQGGALTSTYTASQGLLLMIPNMYKIAGEMLPCVLHVAARSIATQSLSIFGDHQDIYATRMTGFCILASSSVQDASYLSGIAHASAIKAGLPFLHFFDGFRTSHEIDKIEVLEKEDWMEFLDKEALLKFQARALNPQKPDTKGLAFNDDIYFQAMEVRNPFYEKAVSIVSEYMDLLNQKYQTNYAPFVYYGDKEATEILIAMGSINETIKETVDDLCSKGRKVGLIEVHLYRPFSAIHLKKVLPKTVLKIAVLDRTKEAGSEGEPLYLDVVSALKEESFQIAGGRFGLASKNTTPRDIKAVYDMLESHFQRSFTIGIEDDVTHLSLKVDPFYKLENHQEYLIYGFGSDGMVSASKSIMKMVGDLTDKYVQGYFEYDSKKSGGVTKGHLRFGTKPIRSSYYVENPSLIAISKDRYLEEFDTLSSIKENGIILVNTSHTKEEFLTHLKESDKKIIVERNCQVYLVRAYELARKIGLKNKISTIMETVILQLSDLLDSTLSQEYLKKQIENTFLKKGKDVVKANVEAIAKAFDYVEKIKVQTFQEVEKKENFSVYEAMTKRLGNDLPVSAFLDRPDGSFEAGTTRFLKRGISDVVPKWIMENCIQCNQCSFVCPHSVIRPFLLSEEEYQKSPSWIQRQCLHPIEKELENYYFTIGISIKDCTGCGLCIKNCPGKRGSIALLKEKLDVSLKERTQECADYLMNSITDKKIDPKTVKLSQFKSSKFLYPGACAGCGEPSYIRLLTQLFGDRLIIANATGCSSIYGGSAPDTPYLVPWANSLFEDNAEFGYGIFMANRMKQQQIAKIMKENLENPNRESFLKWLSNPDDFESAKEVFENLDYQTVPEELLPLKEYIIPRIIWTIGGDGWAYDIGFGGIDHVLASSDNVNILVLDTQVYSNTGGQSSKASPIGSIASFTSNGKKVAKKDLARIAMSYGHAYVATVSLGASPMQLLKAFKEAASYDGPSLVIAYCPCISHGIEGGMENSVFYQKLAVECGYFPLFRYHPLKEEFVLDSKKVNFDLYENFLETQTRFKMLKVVNPDKALELLQKNKENALKRFTYYQSLQKENSN